MEEGGHGLGEVGLIMHHFCTKPRKETMSSTYWRKAAATVGTLVCLTVVMSPARVYVDSSATGTGQGGSWADACTDLQTALSAATIGDTILVARGTYPADTAETPDYGMSFVLAHDLTILGGFPSGGAALDERDPAAWTVRLSGDYADGDSDTLCAIRPAADVTLDGLTFEGAGHAILQGDSAGIAMVRCVFVCSDRSPIDGALVRVRACSTLVLNCRFGYANCQSGAILSHDGDLVVVNSVLIGAGQALLRASGATALRNCTVVAPGLESDNEPLAWFGEGSHAMVNTIVWRGDTIGPAVTVDAQGATAHLAVDYSIICRDSSFVPNEVFTLANGASLDYGSGNVERRPDFAGADSHPYSPGVSSPAVNMGEPSVDTAGWGLDVAGNPRIRFGRIDIGAYELQEQPSFARIHVDSGATGADNGTSWTDAFVELHDALAAAGAGDTIWVARGTYFPDRGSGDRTVSYELPAGVHLYGGFAGSETALDHRESPPRGTILSGDIGTRGDTTDNAHRIMRGCREFTLDGFRFHRGGAVQYGMGADGGALYVSGGDRVVIRSCSFDENRCEDGGGAIWLDSVAHASIHACTFERNAVIGEHNDGGGALYLFASTLSITNSLFFRHPDAAVEAEQSVLTVRGCTFGNNMITQVLLDSGCAIEARETDLVVANCIFWDHILAEHDAEIRAHHGSLTIDYCTVHGGNEEIDANTDSAYIGHNIWDTTPAFADTAAGDYSLTAGSHGIDLGDPATDTTGWGLDLAGNPRIHNGRIDVGAFEFQGVAVMPLTPTLTRVRTNCDGTYTAVWGYANPNPDTVTIPVGPDNGFGGAQNRGQPTAFAPGNHHGVFSFVFDGMPVSWTLDGRQASASADSAAGICLPPMLLDAVDSLTVAVGETLVVDLYERDDDSIGRFIAYPANEPADVRIERVAGDTAATVTLDTANGRLMVVPGESHVPGSSIPITLAAISRIDSTLTSRRSFAVAVVRPGFDIRNLTMEQLETGIVRGCFEARRTLTPISLSRGRVSLYDGTSSTRDRMAYLAGVSVVETRAPASRGGPAEWGEYCFSFVPDQKLIYTASGALTGIGLPGWARQDSYTRQPALYGFIWH